MPALFSGISWGTAEVLQQTVYIAKQLDLSVAYLSELAEGGSASLGGDTYTRGQGLIIHNKTDERIAFTFHRSPSDSGWSGGLFFLDFVILLLPFDRGIELGKLALCFLTGDLF